MDKRDRRAEAAEARAVYGDLIDREHHVSAKRPQMPRLSRAAQFAPYAALKGYDDLIRESERETDARRVLDENEIEALNHQLVFLQQLEEAPEASFTVFVPDGKKAGGKYAVLRGRLTRFDEYEHSITLDNGRVIGIENIVRIDSDVLSRNWDRLSLDGDDPVGQE